MSPHPQTYAANNEAMNSLVLTLSDFETEYLRAHLVFNNGVVVCQLPAGEIKLTLPI